GIGTSAPQASLDVASSGTAFTKNAILSRPASGMDANFILKTSTGNTTSNPGDVTNAFGQSYGENGALSEGIEFMRGGGATDGSIAIKTAGTERLRIDTNGNIGIGTNYAGDKLYVAASENRQGVTVTNSTTTAGTVTKLGIGGGTPTWGGINYTNIDNVGESRMSLGTYEGLEFLTVKIAGANGGNVGIGTTSPSSKLDVAGGVKIGNDTSTCSAANQGTLKYIGGQCYLCNGTSWSPFAIASPQVAVVKATTGFPAPAVMDENMTIFSQQVPISTAGFTANSISATLGNDGVRDFIKLPAAGVYQINFSTFGSCNYFNSISAGANGTGLNVSIYKAPNNTTYTLLESYRSSAFTPYAIVAQSNYNTQLNASFVVSVSSNDKLAFQLDFIKSAATGNTCMCGGVQTLPTGGTFTSQIIVNKL
ncbi:MAG: hypothetical protein ACOVOV_18125, partial [Dolichospermum sp.]